jgi:hypothetical protein
VYRTKKLKKQPSSKGLYNHIEKYRNTALIGTIKTLDN